MSGTYDFVGPHHERVSWCMDFNDRQFWIEQEVFQTSRHILPCS